MRIMGLDVGDATIGIAISDELHLIAQGITTIRRTTIEKDINELKSIIIKNMISKIVIGLPKNMNNTIGKAGKKTIEFSKLISDAFPDQEVLLWDERLTTVSAERVLIEANMRRKNRKKVIDKVAAVFILQNYLDSQ